MNKSEIKKGVILALFNIFIFVEEEQADVPLDTFIEDSIQFMSFVVELEKIFDIEFPAEMLLFEKFKSINEVCLNIEAVIAEKN